MRILLMVGNMHPRAGGPPRVVAGMACALAARGNQVQIVALSDPAEHRDIIASWPQLTEQGVDIRLFPFTGPAAFGRSVRLTAYMRQHVCDFDVLHIHGVWEQVLASGSAIFRRAHRPYFVSPHGMLDRWQMRKSVGKKFAARKLLGVDIMLRSANSVIFGTDSEAMEAATMRIRQVTIVPNGVTVRQRDHFKSADVAALRDLFPQSRQWTRTFLFFSRLHAKKGLDVLIDAFALVHEDFPNAGLIAAAIPQDPELERKLRSLISDNRSSFIVLTTELVGSSALALFGMTDVFVLPSHQEGFSIAILEAAAAGLPVLITDKCHMPEFAESGAGIIVPDTVSGVEFGLRDLLSRSDAEILKMGRSAANVVTDNYTWDRVTDMLSALYRSIGEAQ